MATITFLKNWGTVSIYGIFRLHVICEKFSLLLFCNIYVENGICVILNMWFPIRRFNFYKVNGYDYLPNYVVFVTRSIVFSNTVEQNSSEYSIHSRRKSMSVSSCDFPNLNFHMYIKQNCKSKLFSSPIDFPNFWNMERYVLWFIFYMNRFIDFISNIYNFNQS